jgi:hypothetical protein
MKSLMPTSLFSISNMATNRLATWACSLQYSDLPADVIQAAVRSFYNWAGCAIGGSNHPATTIAVRTKYFIAGASNNWISTSHYPLSLDLHTHLS